MSTFQSPKGTFDLIPPQSAVFLAVRETMSETVRRAGYGYVETPAFEDTALFKRGVGESTDIVNKEMYTFTTQGGDLLSASTDLYVPAIAQALGFQEVICTGVRWKGERLWGTLTTPNRRGEEKARCVAALRARHPRMQAVAYGNAASDLAHLKLVERGVLVNGSKHARREASGEAIMCADWW